MIPTFTSNTYPYLPIHVYVGDSFFVLSLHSLLSLFWGGA